MLELNMQEFRTKLVGIGATHFTRLLKVGTRFGVGLATAVLTGIYTDQPHLLHENVYLVLQMCGRGGS